MSLYYWHDMSGHSKAHIIKVNGTIWHTCEATAPTALSEPHSCQKVSSASLILWVLLLPNVSCQQYKGMWEIGKCNVTHCLGSKGHIMTKKETLTTPSKTLRHYAEVTTYYEVLLRKKKKPIMKFWERKIWGKSIFKWLGSKLTFLQLFRCQILHLQWSKSY